MNSKTVAPTPTPVNPERAEEISAPKSVKRLSNGRLVVCVKASFQKIKKALPYILELRARFGALPRGGAIAGCASWKTFCIVHLHRTDRAIRYALAEQNEPVNVQVQQAAPEPRQNLTFKVTTAPISELHPYIHPDAKVTRDVAETADPREVFDTARRHDLAQRGRRIEPAAQIIVRQVQAGEITPREGFNRLQAGIDAIKHEHAEMVADTKALTAKGLNTVEREAVRDARTWLSEILTDFERLGVGAVDPEEVQNVLTPANREILRSCAAWLEAVLSQH